MFVYKFDVCKFSFRSKLTRFFQALISQVNSGNLFRIPDLQCSNERIHISVAAKVKNFFSFPEIGYIHQVVHPCKKFDRSSRNESLYFFRNLIYREVPAHFKMINVLGIK